MSFNFSSEESTSDHFYICARCDRSLLTNVVYDVILLMPSLLTNDAVAVVNLKGSTDLWFH